MRIDDLKKGMEKLRNDMYKEGYAEYKYPSLRTFIAEKYGEEVARYLDEVVERAYFDEDMRKHKEEYENRMRLINRLINWVTDSLLVNMPKETTYKEIQDFIEGFLKDI